MDKQGRKWTILAIVRFLLRKNNNTIYNTSILLMDKKEKYEAGVTPLNFEQATEEHFLERFNRNFKIYATKVNLNRALPATEDGLKNVLRAILYVFYQNTKQLKNNRPFKVAKINADVIGSYHPHGDTSVYNALISATEDYVSLFEVFGTLSSRSTKSTTAARYPEVALSELGVEYLSNMHMATMGESYDGSPMPLALRPRFPYQLMRYGLNIGVGFEGTELPWNPQEVIQAMIAMVKGRMEGRILQTEEIAEHLKAPDMYEGHTLYLSKESLYSLIERGIGNTTVVANITEKGRQLVVEELPYREKAPDLTTSINKKSLKYYENRKTYDPKNRDMIRGLKEQKGTYLPAKHYNSKIRPGGIEILIDLDNSTPAEDVIRDLYNKTNLKRTYLMKYVQVIDKDGEKLNAIIPIRRIIDSCIDNNIDYFRSIYEADLEKLEKDFAINTAMEKATRPEHIDFVLLNMKNKNKVTLLTGREGLDLTVEEAEIVVRQRAGRFSDRDEILRELELYESRKSELLGRLAPESLLRDTLHYLEHRIMGLLANYPRRSEYKYSKLSSVTPQVRAAVEISKSYVHIDGTTIWKDDFYTEEAPCYELKDNDFLIAMTASKFTKIPVSELSESRNPALSYVGERVYSVFPLSAVKDKVILFINTNGTIKSMAGNDLDTRVTSITSAPIKDGEIKTFIVDPDDLDSLLAGFVTRKGYTKAVRLGHFTPKARTAGYLRLTKMAPEDEFLWVNVFGEGFGEAKIETDQKTYEVEESIWIRRIDNLGLPMDPSDKDGFKSVTVTLQNN